MRAWWTYWASIAVAIVVWLGAVLLLGRSGLRSLLASPIGLAILVVPLVVAGLDLVLFRATHEEVCRLEARRHRWLRRLVGDGYSATAFLWTGVSILGLAVVVVMAVVIGGL